MNGQSSEHEMTVIGRLSASTDNTAESHAARRAIADGDSSRSERRSSSSRSSGRRRKHATTHQVSVVGRIACCYAIIIFMGVILSIIMTHVGDSDNDTDESLRGSVNVNVPTAAPVPAATYPPFIEKPIPYEAIKYLTVQPIPTPMPTRQPSPLPTPRQTTTHPTMSPTTSQQPTITLPPMFYISAQRDTYLQSNAQTPFGSKEQLKVALSSTGSAVATTFTLVQFEMKELPRDLDDILPPITMKVTLQLSPIAMPSSSTVTIQVMKQPATRLNIDHLFYDVYPLENAIAKGIAGPNVTLTATMDDMIDIDVTDLTFAPLAPEAIIDGEDDPTNMLLLIRAVEDTGGGVAFHSVESLTGQPPRLQFDFDV